MLTRLYVIEYHGDNQATWECAAGHRWRGVVIDRRRGQARFLRPDAAGVARMASWWSKEKGGCSGECKRCGPSTPAPATRGGTGPDLTAAHCATCGAPSVSNIHGEPEPCAVCAGDPEAVAVEQRRKAHGAKFKKRMEDEEDGQQA